MAKETPNPPCLIYYLEVNRLIQVYKNIYIGNEKDAREIINSKDWSFVHCCKEPYHRKMVGYSKRSLDKEHPNYGYIIKDNRMALNIIDANFYNKDFLPLTRDIFENTFAFVDAEYERGQKILFNCNLGGSRAPSIAFLYLSKRGAYSKDFLKAFNEFSKDYPIYAPRLGIFLMVKNCWEHFVPQDSNEEKGM